MNPSPTTSVDAAEREKKAPSAPPVPKQLDAQTDIEIRPLEDFEDYLASLKLQQDTWGKDFNDLTSPSLQIVAQKIGGLAAGAFASSGQLVGMVFGLTGPREDDALVHWSHMVAVREGWRGRGIGLRIKRYQRWRMIEQGVETICWTYDPLEAANAHFNINRLGVQIEAYTCDLYGSGESSTLHQGLGTDRFTARWSVKAERVRQALQGCPPPQKGRAQAPNVIVGASGSEEQRLEADVGAQAALLRLEIPARIQSVKKRHPERAVQWRQVTREAFMHYMKRGYEVDGFYRDDDMGQCFYVLKK